MQAIISWRILWLEKLAIELDMPTISMFYGIIIRMYFFDNQQHNLPHVHVHYQDYSAIVEIPSGSVIEGKLPKAKLKLVDAWI